MNDSGDPIDKIDLPPSDGPKPLDDDSERRLIEAVQSYMEELEQGRRPDRREWLARYSGIAQELNECLEGLDLVHEAADSIHASLPANRDAESCEWSSEPIGDFQIVREIGRGGMGIIYEAIQLSLNRRVALKVLPFAASIDSKCLQRFRQEAQAAAQLHHNHIVPIYAVGCDRGIHYYAMQLIDGLSLDRIVHQMRLESPLSSMEGTLSDTISLLPLESGQQPVARDETAEKPPAHESRTNLHDSTLAQSREESMLTHFSADLSTHRGARNRKPFAKSCG